MATYPTDATLDVSTFSVVSSNTMTTDNPTATSYVLPTVASSTAEVIVSLDGVTQATTSYILTSSTTINFTTAPGSGVELAIKVVAIPTRFLINRTINDALAVSYSNTSTTTIDSNTFLINANTESFVFPVLANITTTPELFVYISGLYQDSNNYTYPSIVYDNQGIDIGDNTATKLLTNFDGADGATTTTDASPSAHTVTLLNGAALDTAQKQFGTASLELDGTNDDVRIPASDDFHLLGQDFTLECFVRPTGNTTQTIVSRSNTVNDNYRLDLQRENNNFAFIYTQESITKSVTGGGTATAKVNQTITATVNGTISSKTALVVDGNVGTIVTGMKVTGTGITPSTNPIVTVTVTDQQNLVLSENQSLSDGVTLTFGSGDVVVDTNVNTIIPGMTVTGTGITSAAGELVKVLTVTNQQTIKIGTVNNTYANVQSIANNVDLTFTMPVTDKFIHVAVVMNYSDSENVSLYVNNVRCDTQSFVGFNVESTLLDDAPLLLGNANIDTKANNFGGHIDALRLARSRKYNTANSIAMISAPTVIGGGALGAIQADDKLTIRLVDMERSIVDRFSSMADRKPDKGFTTQEKFDVATFTSQAGYEKRRLKSRRPKRQFGLTYTNVSGMEKSAIENFYRARNGEYETFTFDLSHINESGTLHTRFGGDLSITEVLSSGTTYVDNFYTISFTLQEVFD